MNFTRNLLVVSLALNAAWFGGVIFADSSSDETPASPEAAGPKHAAPAASPLDLAGSRETNLQIALRAHDLATLRDELRRAGFPEDELRSILGTRAWKRAHAAALPPPGQQPPPHGP